MSADIVCSQVRNAGGKGQRFQVRGHDTARKQLHCSLHVGSNLLLHVEGFKCHDHAYCTTHCGGVLVQPNWEETTVEHNGGIIFPM